MLADDKTMLMSLWDDVVSFFPKDWREIADKLCIMKGARQDKNLDATMRTLMMHLACGYSLKETVARAKMASTPLYTSSHVALRDRLIKFSPFFKELCSKMINIHAPSSDGETVLRLVDATDIHENGPTGSNWRFHYSFSLPSLSCDFTKLTETHGEGTGENLTQFPVLAGDHIIADRGYSRATGVTYADKNGAKVCIRLNYSNLKLLSETGKPFGLLSKLKQLKNSGDAAEWKCAIRSSDDSSLIHGRICAIRKNAEQIAQSAKRVNDRARRHKSKVSSDTYFVNEYIILFTTFENDKYPLRKMLEIYRWRWQIELLFKRLKSLIQFGHLPTREDDSSKAWLYGKLFVALLIEHISRSGNGSFSPWRQIDNEEDACKSMETLCFSSSLSGENTDSVDVTT